MSRPALYTDRQRFCVMVMWLAGFSARQISLAMPRVGLAPMTANAAMLMIKRESIKQGLSARSDLSAGQRQAWLNECQRSPLNDGTLPPQTFKVQR